MKRFFVIISLLSALQLTAMGQTELTAYVPGVTTEGAIYFLPKTNIRVSVLIEKRTFKPGTFSKYAMRFLRLNNVEQQPTTSYRVLSVKQEPYPVADPEKSFSVRFNAKSVAANVALSDDGCLLAINARPNTPQEPAVFTPAPKPHSLNPHDFMSEEILSAGSTAKMAELTAREIYDLLENRNMLIKGQADFMPGDGAQMQMMLNQLEAQDRALTSLFTGTTECDTTEAVFNVNPEGTMKHQVLFRMSKIFGAVDADDLSGEPYYIDVEDLNILPVSVEQKESGRKRPESGIFVNVPGRMRSTIYKDGDQLTVMEMPAPQFGNVELLSGELFNKRYTTHLWLNRLTGAVEKLEAEQPK